jgi:hypothetical protein
MTKIGKLLEKRINEKSYDDFMDREGDGITANLKLLKKQKDQPTDEQQEELIETLSVYDKEVIRLFTEADLSKITLGDITYVAQNINNRHGTEMSMVARALEDVIDVLDL